MKTNTYLSVFYSLFVFILAFVFAAELSAGYAKESWQITEWLINYQGGFVRRGLPGEIILTLYRYLGIRPYVAIISFSALAYLLLSVFFVKSFLRKGYPILILPFVFFLGGPVLNDFWVRKDVLVILIFVLVIYYSSRESRMSLLIANTLLILGLLVHESIGFIGFPILFLVRLNRRNNSAPEAVVQLLPSLLVFFLCLYDRGSVTISHLIWDSWKPVAFPIQDGFFSQPPAAIDALSWSTKTGLSYSFHTLRNFNDGIYAPLAWCLILISIYYVLVNVDVLKTHILKRPAFGNVNKTDIATILILQFIGVIPLFVLGWDYGRWVFLWVSSSFAILVLIPEEEFPGLFPGFVSAAAVKANLALDAAFCRSKELSLLLILIIGVPVGSWSMYDFLRTSPAIVMSRNMSTGLYQIMFLVKTALKSMR